MAASGARKLERLVPLGPSEDTRAVVQIAMCHGDRLPQQYVIDDVMLKSGKRGDEIGPRLPLDLDADHVIVVVKGGFVGRVNVRISDAGRDERRVHDRHTGG